MRHKKIPCRFCSDGVLVAHYSKKKIDTCYKCGMRRTAEREAKKKKTSEEPMDGQTPYWMHNDPTTRKVVVIKRDSSSGEFRVPAPDGREAGAYYTDDMGDAIGTAKAMWGGHHEFTVRRGHYDWTEEGSPMDNPGDIHIDIASHNAKENPPTRSRSKGVEIYRHIVEVRALKADGRAYKHAFGKGSRILGLPDGSLLIVNDKGKRLWKDFETDGKGNRR